MEDKSSRGTPDEKIASTAKVWRHVDKEAIADKKDPIKQRAEYQERKNLRKVIDESRSHS